MIGTATLIGAGLSALSAGAGAWLGKKAADDERKRLDGVERRNENWYNKNFNEDPLQRLGAQAAWTRANEAVKAHRRASAGRAAVMGSTPEQTQADATQGLNMLGETAGNIAAGADARRDNIEQQYMARQDNIEAQRAGVAQQQMQSIASAAQAGAKFGQGMIGLDSPAGGGSGSVTVNSEEKK